MRLPAGTSNIVGLGAIGQALRPLIPVHESVVFYCVKSYDLENALLENANAWPSETPFVILSNGYVDDVVSQFKEKHLTRPVRLGITTLGATFNDVGQLVVQSDGAMTSWGNWTEPKETATEAENRIISQNPTWSWHDDIRPLIKRKWIFNVVLNTLCGALRLSHNGLLQNHKALADSLFQEAYQLAGEIWPLVDVSSAPTMLQEFWNLVKQTALNENSMARDVRLGRHTESDRLAGMSLNKVGYRLLKTYHAKVTR